MIRAGSRQIMAYKERKKYEYTDGRPAEIL